MTADARWVLPGSESRPVSGAERIGPIDPDEHIEVSVLVRPRRPAAELAANLERSAAGEQPYLSREEFAARYGADPSDLDKVAAFARQHGLKVVESSPARRTVRLEGRIADVSAAFGVTLKQFRLPAGRSFRGYEGSISVPGDLKDAVQGVFGLDDRPVAQPRDSE